MKSCHDAIKVRQAIQVQVSQNWRGGLLPVRRPGYFQRLHRGTKARHSVVLPFLSPAELGVESSCVGDYNSPISDPAGWVGLDVV